MFRTQCSGHNVQDTMFRTQCSGHNVQDTMFRTQCSGTNVQDTMFRTQCSGHNVQDTMFRTQCSIISLVVFASDSIKSLSNNDYDDDVQSINQSSLRLLITPLTRTQRGLQEQNINMRNKIKNV